jgi:hypothetical protein
MMAVFSEFVEEIVEVFMDDFSVCGKTFADCLAILVQRGRLGAKLGEMSLHGEIRNSVGARDIREGDRGGQGQC